MIVFDSNNPCKWSGRGFVLNKSQIIVNKNANFKHQIIINKGDYQLKIYAKNRVGTSTLKYKIITENNIVLESGAINLSKNWNEEVFNFEVKKNFGFCYLNFFRENGDVGSSEIGRIILNKNKSIVKTKITNNKQSLMKTNFKIQQKKLAIAFVIPYHIFGGAEVFAKNIISSLNTELFDIHIIALKDNPIKFYLKESISYKKISSLDVFSNYLKIHNIDYLVYYNSIKAYELIQEAIALINFKPKLIEIYHSDFKWPDALANLNYRNNIDLVFKTAPELLNNVSGIKKQVHLPVPIDTSRFCFRELDKKDLKLPNNSPIIGTVARLSAEKNINYILDIAKNCPEFNFIILGEGNQEKSLKIRVSSEKISNVFFLGFQKNIEKYYNYFDGFLLTSHMEGTPISILEAMASGVPVFTTNVGSISSIITDQETGFFLSCNLEKDCQLIKNQLFNQSVIDNAYNYILKTHRQEIIIKNFVNELISTTNNFILNENYNLLPGEYV